MELGLADLIPLPNNSIKIHDSLQALINGTNENNKSTTHPQQHELSERPNPRTDRPSCNIITRECRMALYNVSLIDDVTVSNTGSNLLLGSLTSGERDPGRTRGLICVSI